MRRTSEHSPPLEIACIRDPDVAALVATVIAPRHGAALDPLRVAAIDELIARCLLEVCTSSLRADVEMLDAPGDRRLRGGA